MRRVVLREPRAEDIAQIDVWLPEAAGAVAGSSSAGADRPTLSKLLTGFTPTERPSVILRDGRAVGLVLVATDGNALQIDFLAIAEKDRNLGLGAEAVYELEDRNPGYVVLAGIPVANGLAIYFWLRTGYRPLYPRDRTSTLPADRLWMTRQTDAVRSR